MKHIVAVHAVKAGERVTDRIVSDVADVHGGTTGVRKILQNVFFGLRTIVVGVVEFGFFPLLLPFWFNLFGVVALHEP